MEKQNTAIAEIYLKRDELSPNDFYLWMTTNKSSLLAKERKQIRDAYNNGNDIGGHVGFNEYFTQTYKTTDNG